MKNEDIIDQILRIKGKIIEYDQDKDLLWIRQEKEKHKHYVVLVHDLSHALSENWEKELDIIKANIGKTIEFTSEDFTYEYSGEIYLHVAPLPFKFLKINRKVVLK